ncbi:EamA domain-containing membrane protein RarD [Agromyces sp. CF514]|uniref:DMT family transporter n=1 Tax=Agromyces sp. CF514 TaxID=1881031 RepID=UPI0008DF8780|nr:DMT family transporter [Agromyces sp. CF514]SFR79401.1 EamA domain-containing membrane protein RarD [Agromyces sp. CF514]
MPQHPARRDLIVGVVAMATAILLWASFALTLRGVGGSSLTTVDLSMLRFAAPVVVLAPWIPRAVREVGAERRATLVLLLVGGLPHFLVSALGGHLAPAALVGLIIPGTVPLFVTVIAFATLRGRMPVRQAASVTLIVAGVAAAALLMADSVPPLGLAALLAAGFVWAVYTLGLKRSSLSLTSTVLVICAPSALIAGALAVTGAMPSNLLAGSARPGDVVLFTVLQGIGTGVVSTIAYAHAVRVLGSGIAATAGALSPVVAAGLAVPLLGEPITAGIVVAMAIIVSGVLVFNAPGHRRAIAPDDGCRMPPPSASQGDEADARPVVPVAATAPATLAA